MQKLKNRNSHVMPTYVIDEVMAKLNGDEFRCLSLIYRTQDSKKILSLHEILDLTAIKTKHIIKKCFQSLEKNLHIKKSVPKKHTHTYIRILYIHAYCIYIYIYTWRLIHSARHPNKIASRSR